jgi:hypothetical protein
MENKNHQAIRKANQAMAQALEHADQAMKRASIAILEFGIQMDKRPVSEQSGSSEA